MRLLAALLASIALPAQAQQVVQIPADAKAGISTLNGLLFEAKGDGTHPAIVAMHGCGGLYQQSGKVDARFTDWGKRLSDAGYVVVFPDSFGSRNAGSQCREAHSAIRPAYERAADVRSALGWLQGRADVKADAIALMGWSQGSITGLWSVTPGAAPAAPLKDFKAAILFYAGCASAHESDKWQPRLPVLLLSGAADDWTPAAPCEELAKKFPDKVRITNFPGAYHEFDHPMMKLHEISGIPRAANGKGTVHVGADDKARDTVRKLVPEELAKALR